MRIKKPTSAAVQDARSCMVRNAVDHGIEPPASSGRRQSKDAGADSRDGAAARAAGHVSVRRRWLVGIDVAAVCRCGGQARLP